MRDPNRIDKYCERLAAMWKKVPDWRFGQLLSNLLGRYIAETSNDIFFPEDEDMFAALEYVMDEIMNGNP